LTWEDEDRELILFTTDLELQEGIDCCKGVMKIVVKEEGESLTKRDPQNLANMLDVFKDLISTMSSQNGNVVPNLINNNNNNNNADEKKKKADRGF